MKRSLRKLLTVPAAKLCTVNKARIALLLMLELANEVHPKVRLSCARLSHNVEKRKTALLREG
jgi:hypothetical protein